MPARKAAPPAFHSAAAAAALPHSADAHSGQTNSFSSGGIHGVLDRAASLAALRLLAEALQRRRDTARERLTEVTEFPCGALTID